MNAAAGASTSLRRLAPLVAGARRRASGSRPAPAREIPPARLSDEELPALDFTAPRWEGTHEAHGGARVFVRRLPALSPHAEPALFVHGLGGSATNWTDLGVLLNSWLDCVAIDLPGFGRSGPAPGNDYSLDALARVVVAQIEDDGRSPVHLFGNSMGGSVALRVAARRPDLVRTLTLVSPAVPDLRVKRPGTDTGMTLFLLPGLNALARRRMAAISPASRVRGMIELCFAQPERVPQWRLREAVEDMAERHDVSWNHDALMRAVRALAASYLAGGRRSPWYLLSRITAPTLVVWGSLDRLVPVTLAARAAGTVADARLLVLPDVGHCAQMEDPVSTARAFLAMLCDTQTSDAEKSPAE